MMTNQSNTVFFPKPLWERWPEERFLGAHRMILADHFEKWSGNGPITLHKFISRYVDGLPAELPPVFLPKLVQIAIEIFEKKKAEAPLLQPA